MGLLVYYSSATGNTHHFVGQLQQKTYRLLKDAEVPLMNEPYVLVVPTYAGGDGRGAVPETVVRFLNEETNRSFLRGVITGGNRNFGWAFGLAGNIIAEKCKVPCLYKFELRGTTEDVEIVSQGLKKLWDLEENGK